MQREGDAANHTVGGMNDLSSCCARSCCRQRMRRSSSDALCKAAAEKAQELDARDIAAFFAMATNLLDLAAVCMGSQA